MASRIDIPIYDGKVDFGSWQKKMKALLSYNKVAIAIEGDEKKWSDEQKAKKSEIEEEAYNLLILSLSDNVLRKVDDCSTPLTIWGTINLKKVSSEENPSDMGTKIVSITKFKHCLNLLNVG